MKTVVTITSLLCTLSLQLPAAASGFPYAENTARQICQDTRNNNRSALLQTIKENRLLRRDVVEKVVCNGQPLMAFARAERANKVVRLLEPTERSMRQNVLIKEVIATP